MTCVEKAYTGNQSQEQDKIENKHSAEVLENKIKNTK